MTTRSIHAIGLGGLALGALLLAGGPLPAQAAPLLVPLVEEGWLDGEVPRLAVRRYVEADDHFCLTYGDGVSDVDIGASIAFHRAHGKIATVTLAMVSSVRPRSSASRRSSSQRTSALMRARRSRRARRAAPACAPPRRRPRGCA